MKKVLSVALVGITLGLGAAGVQAQMQANGCGPGGWISDGSPQAGGAGSAGFCAYSTICGGHYPGNIPSICIQEWKRLGLWEKSEDKAGSSGGRKPPPLLPSKWGAVARNNKTGVYDTSFGERSKAEAIKLALSRCGSGCETLVVYANQCVSGAEGAVSGGLSLLRQELDTNSSQAEQKALAACNAEAKNCQILFTECSLP